MNLFDHDLFLFDFDGLFVNTEPLHFKAYNLALRDYGVDFDWDFCKYCLFAHMGTQVFSEAVFKDFPSLQKAEPSWEKVRETKIAHYQELVKLGPVKLMPGVTELIQELKIRNLRSCIVTNSNRADLEIIANHLPFIRQIEWITRENYQEAKPAPDGYLVALEKFGGEKPVGFEDTLKGILSLQAAGVKPILVCENNHPQLQDRRLKGVLHYQRIYPLNAFCQE
ncbi:MAG: HAD family phosphatase [Candidatus Algichlamydia australiensis]|nr:HAD family phosphatase [Chlamydiales bacterium]